MVKLTRLDGSEFTINASLIEVVEAKPDTVVTLINNKRYMVKETPEEIAELISEFYRTSGGLRLVVYEDHCYHNEESA
ncbi:MAG TPA: flagellar FlbD family protein [Candidatus Aquicultor sp.]